MQQQLSFEQRLGLTLELREHQAREAAQARLVQPGPPRRLRSVVGLSLVRLGQRLAAEPSLQPARPR